MDRRELLKQGAALACVAALPKLLDLPLVAQNSGLPRLAWPETTASLAHRNAMLPSLKKLSADRRLTTLTPDEWDTLAIHHQYYHGMHGEVGHLKAVDAVIQTHQTYLKTRYNPASIDMIMAHGSYAMCLRDAGKFHEIAMKLRLEEHGQLLQGGHLVDAQYYSDCEKFFTAMAIWFFLISLLVGPEVGIFFAYVAVANDTASLLGCP